MSDADQPTPPRAQSRMSGDEVRSATFPPALRGYDREAVHAMLDRVADWMEEKGSAVAGAAPAVKDELAKVGERTAGILTAAEEAARGVRDEATEYADRLRKDSEDETRKARLNASQRMDEMIADAEKKAQEIMDEAVARRRQLNQAIASLVDRRDEIAAEAAKLGEELLGAVEGIRAAGSASAESSDEPVSEEIVFEPDSDETHIEPLSEEIPVEGESGELSLEDDSEEMERQPPTLLVDPDDESEEATRIHRPSRED